MLDNGDSFCFNSSAFTVCFIFNSGSSNLENFSNLFFKWSCSFLNQSAQTVQIHNQKWNIDHDEFVAPIYGNNQKITLPSTDSSCWALGWASICRGSSSAATADLFANVTIAQFYMALATAPTCPLCCLPPGTGGHSWIFVSIWSWAQHKMASPSVDDLRPELSLDVNALASPALASPAAPRKDQLVSDSESDCSSYCISVGGRRYWPAKLCINGKLFVHKDYTGHLPLCYYSTRLQEASSHDPNECFNWRDIMWACSVRFHIDRLAK